MDASCPTPPKTPQRKRGKAFTGKAGLKGLPQVIQLCADKVVAGVPGYEEVLLEVLRKIEEPLNLSDVRDDRRQRQAVLRTLDATSRVLFSPVGTVRGAAAKVVQLMVSDMKTKGHDDINPPRQLSRKRDTRFKCLEESQTITTLCTVIPKLTGPLESLACLRALCDASCYTSVSKCLLEKEGVLKPLMMVLASIMDTRNIQDGRISVIVETLWNMLDLVPSCRRDLGCVEYLSILYVLYKELLQSGHRLKDKELRNDVLSIATIVAGDQATHENFLTTNWTHIIWLASCGGEIIPSDPVYKDTIKPFASTTSQDDFDMKKTLWHLMYLLSFTDSNLKFLLDKGIIAVLLCYIDSGCDVPAVVRWPLTQLVELQMQALHILSQMCVGGSGQLAEGNAPRILLSFLGECVGDQLRNTTLKVLSRVVCTENKKMMAEQGAVGIILSLAEAAPELEIKSNCVRILSSIVDGQRYLQKEFANAGGIDILMLFLTLDSPTRTLESDELVFSTVDCIWSCVIGCKESEDSFIEMEGIHALLDELTVAPMWVCVPLLSCLEDFLASNNSAIEELLEWKSSTGAALAQVLIKMWETDSNGSTKRILPESIEERPFTSVFGEAEIEKILSGTKAPEAKEKPLLDILDALQGPTDKEPPSGIQHDIKVKIYCIFSKVFQRDSKALRVLSNAEKMQLQVILSYAALRRDRVWYQIDEALRQGGTVPIGQDRKRLEKAKEAAERRWKAIREEQIKLQAASEVYADIEEKTFYKLLVKKKNDTLTTKQTTTGLSITEAKIRKAQMLKASFMSATSATDAANKIPDTVQRKPSRREQDVFTEVFDFKKLESEISELIISARTDPTPIIDKLETILKSITADGTLPAGVEGPGVLSEGKAGVMQAISFLKTLRELPRLTTAPGLILAAADHASNQKDKDHVDHVGGDNSTALSRMNRYGMVVGASAESFCLGQNTAMGIILDLVINDGISSKADRLNLFSPEFRYFGVSCNTHKVHKYQCVIDMTADYQNKPRTEQQNIHTRFETLGHQPLPVAIPVL
eukprot:TRINITY_DN14686_c0_g1_i2.p1 TRINITY_DN14686_c0_g1~~TRINITY_DN14686_c0_g1_i2.p1  ORF type:complete len:1043 (+),score=211.31 TRINITY_DN14686_c0_g1_i2:178-3306(+)